MDKIQSGKTLYSANEDRWDNGSGCLETAIGEVWDQTMEDELYEGVIICVYKGTQTAVNPINYLPSVSDAVADACYDDCSDYADGWLDGLCARSTALQGHMEKAFEEWLTTNKLHPEFWMVEDISTVKVKLTLVDVIHGDYEWEVVE